MEYMKKKIKLLLLIIILFLFTNNHTYSHAADKVQLLNVSSDVFSFDDNFWYDTYIYKLFEMDKDGDLELFFSEYSQGIFSVKIYSGDYSNVVYCEDIQLSSNATSYIIENVECGDYCIEIEANDNSSFIDLTINVTYINDTEFRLNSTSATMIKGKTKQLEIESNILDAYYDVDWESSNPSIATVSEDGLVKAKKKGKVAIIAYIVLYDGYEEKCFDLECEITVQSNDPSFSQVVKQMKKMGKSKNFTFKMKEKNKRAVLYMNTNVLKYYDTIEKKGYGYVWHPQPYIEVKKQGMDILLSLKMKSYVILATSNSNDYLEFDKIVFGKKSSYVKYGYKSEDKYKRFWWGLSVKNPSTIVLSTSTTTNMKKLNKLSDVLKKKYCPIKVGNEDSGAYVKGYVTKNGNKYFPKCINYYKKLLKMYQ